MEFIQLAFEISPIYIRERIRTSFLGHQKVNKLIFCCYWHVYELRGKIKLKCESLTNFYCHHIYTKKSSIDSEIIVWKRIY